MVVIACSVIVKCPGKGVKGKNIVEEEEEDDDDDDTVVVVEGTDVLGTEVEEDMINERDKQKQNKSF